MHVAQGAVEKVPAPSDLFHSLYQHFLCLADAELRLRVPEARIGPRLGAESSVVLAAAVLGDPEVDRELCARAMAMLYHAHASSIGAS